jgi:hypothetical protein
MAQDLTGDADEEAAPTLADRLAAVRVRLAAVRPFTDFAAKVAELETEEKTLMEEERADRPLPRRLQSAMDTLFDRESKARKTRSAAEEARAAWEAAEAQAVQAEKEENLAREALAKVEQEATRAVAPPTLDVDAVKNALDSLAIACGAVLTPGDGGGAAAMVEQVRAALNAKAAETGNMASAPAGGSVAAVAPGGASVSPAAGGQDAGAGQWRDGTAKRVVAVAARPSGRRGTSPAMASCDSSDGESGRSRSRERKERDQKEAVRVEQERTTREVVDGRQRTIGDALTRGAA